MEATITYTAGLSYSLMGTKFERGVGVPTNNRALIKYCQNTGGFNVVITKRAPTPKVRKVVRNEAGEPVTAKPPKTKKKTHK